MLKAFIIIFPLGLQ